MKIRIGFDLTYECAQATPMVLMLNVHPSRAKDLLIADELKVAPEVPMSQFIDMFGNICTRLVAPKGEIRFWADALVFDSGEPDAVAPEAHEIEIGALPDDVLPFLNGSRYCETDRLMNVAWSLFSGTPRGWARVQAICDFVHSHIEFGYHHAHAAKSAHDVLEERKGVCRDFAHLAVALCRCMGIPARYCTGYLGDIGVPLDPEPMDWSAWFEVYLGGRWYTFDARHNTPRIGRIVMARGRDATDVAISTTYGANILKGFKVVTVEAEAKDESAMLETLTPAAFRRWYGTEVALTSRG
jgi:transglutaminase-like putative cysteine protease